MQLHPDPEHIQSQSDQDELDAAQGKRRHMATDPESVNRERYPDARISHGKDSLFQTAECGFRSGSPDLGAANIRAAGEAYAGVSTDGGAGR